MRLSHSSLSGEGVPGISVSLDRFSVLLMYTLQQSVQLVTLVEVQVLGEMISDLNGSLYQC